MPRAWSNKCTISNFQIIWLPCLKKINAKQWNNMILSAFNLIISIRNYLFKHYWIKPGEFLFKKILLNVQGVLHVFLVPSSPAMHNDNNGLMDDVGRQLWLWQFSFWAPDDVRRILCAVGVAKLVVCWYQPTLEFSLSFLSTKLNLLWTYLVSWNILF